MTLQMTEHTKKRNEKMKLPCNWVDEEGFTVTPTQRPIVRPEGMSDTAFLLKSKLPARPNRFPTP
jgi:hypothetical protein